MAINNTNSIISLKDIAQFIEDDLNLLSITMYNEGDISEKPVFNITADTQEYDRLTTTEDNESNSVLYTPGILTKVDFEIRPNKNLSMYSEAYNLELYGYYDEMDSVRIIYDRYVIQQKDNPYKVFNSWLINRQAGSIDFAAPIDPEDGSGLDRFLSASGFFYSFLDGGIHSSQISLKIDDVVIPFSSAGFADNKTVKGGQYSNSDDMQSRPTATSFSFGFSSPILSSNTELANLTKDLLERRLGSNYTISYTDGIVDVTYNMYPTKIEYNIEEGGVATLSCSFNLYRTEGI